MKMRFVLPPLTAGMVLLLVGCAGTTDCSGALETAREAARERQPLAQWIAQTEDACAAEAERAWASSLAESCAPLHGFHAGHAGAEAAEDCTAAGYQSARNLGQMLAEMQAEAAAIEKRLGEQSLAQETRRDLQRRKVVIERDLPQLEALARMDGYLAPAEVPDSDQ